MEETDEVYTGYPRNLFDWLRLINVAQWHGKVDRRDAALACTVAMNSDGASGQRVVLDVERLAAEFAVDERTIYRRFTKLVDAGWFEQTTKPSRGRKGEAGRRARYRVTFAPVDLSDVFGLDRVTPRTADLSDDAVLESSDTDHAQRGATIRRENDYHLTESGESSDTDHAQGCHSPTSVGPTTTSRGSTSTTGRVRAAADARRAIAGAKRVTA